MQWLFAHLSKLLLDNRAVIEIDALTVHTTSYMRTSQLLTIPLTNSFYLYRKRPVKVKHTLLLPVGSNKMC